MGKSLLIEKEIQPKEDMEVYNNPNKRIRLDLSNNIGNDDLWGEDLTAEEFDMLEVQATQSHQQDDPPSTFVQPFVPSAFENNLAMTKADEAKQQLYELEGKVKILTQSLEKASKDLKDEKLKSIKLINEKMQQSLSKENDLRKEIKKVESALQFKDQEMKSVYEKVHLLETQLQEKKQKPDLSTNQTSANSFLEKFQFKAEGPVRNSSPTKEIKSKSSRKHKLLVDTSEGKVQGSEIITTILCNRLSLSTSHSNIHQAHQLPSDSLRKHRHLSALSIIRLSKDQQTEELFDYFSGVFTSYLDCLKLSKTPTVNTNVNSPLRRKDVKLDRGNVISCLKDLVCIISSSQFLSLLQRCRNEERNSNEVEMASVSSTSAAQPPTSNAETDEHEQRVSKLLTALVSLSKPESYPVHYVKSEEIELSLSCLVSWSALSPESFVSLIETLFHSSIICYEDVAPLLLSLKLITNLCTHKEYISILQHKNDSCLLCTMSSLLMQKIPQHPLKYSTIMFKIENFLSLIFTVHNPIELKLVSAPCSSTIFQGVVTSLCKFYDIYEDGNDNLLLVLKKGFTLVHQLSRYLPNCKERRAPVEDSYISLVCGMLTLSKESPLFKEFYDLVHDLWDFQEDTTEFDLEDSSEESPPMADQTSQSGH